ncbi:hypothetical protein ACLB2K_036927 [Fragaria x ananassa]
MLLFTLGEIRRALSSSRVIILINRRASETLLSELELRQWDDGVVEAEPSSSLRLRERERSEGCIRQCLGVIAVEDSASLSWLSRLHLRRRRGFGFVAVEASASSPSRLRLRRRRGFCFVAAEASASLSSRLWNRHRGFDAVVIVFEASRVASS